MPGVLVYLGIGFLVLAAGHGAMVDWTSAWTYAVLLAWPFALLYYLTAFIGAALIWIVAFFIFVGIVMYVWGRVQDSWKKWRSHG